MIFSICVIETKAISAISETNKLIFSVNCVLDKGFQIANTWMEQLENVQYYLLYGQLEFILIFGSPKIYKF